MIASGPYQGIIVNKLTENYDQLATQFPCSFSVWISQDGGKTLKQVIKNFPIILVCLKQEIRSFRFCFYNHITMAERAATSQRFIKSLFERSFPKGKANYHILK
jgi:hypothetical protein